MQIGHSGQYGVPCVIVAEEEEVDAEALIDLATLRGAIYNDGEDYYFVVQLLPRLVELYTEAALRRSLRAPQPQSCRA